MLSVHRGKVFGFAGMVVFMLAALMLPLFCITGYLLYMDRRRKQANAKAARHPAPETAQIHEGFERPARGT